ncbi:hypothetical protein ACEPT0_17250 [Pseudomonas paraeruginosa]|uniref:hypothetical protein n=1 Tax=Pseudomonas aeruginosa group TaxID=136841 RepID=UPI000A5ECF27|nr:hypothetical protein [Pseudomonas aeruginosa]
MKYITNSVLHTVTTEHTSTVMERLINRLQETADTLEQRVSIKRKLSKMRREIEDGTIDSEIIQDLVFLHALSIGSWQEQTERTHLLACIYAATAQICLKQSDIVSAMAAILEASTFHGISAAISHPRKISELERARAGALKKASNHKEKKEKLIELLKYQKPKNGWSGSKAAAEAIAPNFQKFLTHSLNLPADTPEKLIAEITHTIDKYGLI